jgi:hypothetical protein
MTMTEERTVHETRAVVQTLERERQAAEALRISLAQVPGMDEDTIRDTIEGETGLHEGIVFVAELLTDAEVMSKALDIRIKEMQSRQARYDTKVEYLRTTLEQAMLIGDIRTKVLPDCTLTLAKRAAGLVITDEHLIPAEFWTQPDPVLNRGELKKALKDKRAIEGAHMGNGGVSLTIKRS